MTKLLKIVALMVGFSVLVGGLAVMTSSPAPAAGSAPVNIAAVSVASVPVGGTVSVGNTPSVNVANTPTVNFAAGSSVKVNSPLDDSGHPIPLRVVEALQPFEDSCLATFTGSENAFCSFKSVPSGKQLVIQEVDVRLSLESGLKPISIAFSGALPRGHEFTATFMGTFALPSGAPDTFVTHQETHLYEGPNSTPGCFLEASNYSVSGSASCSFSGVLVDVP